MSEEKKKNPISRFIDHLQEANEQAYCGDSHNCQPLSYAKGNIPTPPKRAKVWEECPIKDETGKPVE